MLGSGFGGNFIGGRINAGGPGAIGGNVNRSISGPSLSNGLGNFGVMRLSRALIHSILI